MHDYYDIDDPILKADLKPQLADPEIDIQEQLYSLHNPMKSSDSKASFTPDVPASTQTISVVNRPSQTPAQAYVPSLIKSPMQSVCIQTDPGAVSDMDDVVMRTVDVSQVTKERSRPVSPFLRQFQVSKEDTDPAELLPLPIPCINCKVTESRFSNGVFKLENAKWHLCQNCMNTQFLTPLKSADTNDPIMVRISSSEPYSEFAPSYALPLLIKGTRWPSLLHFFEAQKYSIHPDIVLTIKMGLPTVRELEDYINNHCQDEFPRGDWEDMKDTVMLDGALNRFKQHPALANMLLNTNDRHILYINNDDLYWGVGAHGSGQNKFGELLMRIRSMTEDEVRNDIQLLLT